MVITGLIRNQFGCKPTWVRIPHPPPQSQQSQRFAGLFLCSVSLTERLSGRISMKEVHLENPGEYSLFCVYCILWWKNGGITRQNYMRSYDAI